MIEGGERGMNERGWRDGTQDSKQGPGLMSFIHDDPTAGAVVGGIDQAANTWWRNRATLGINAATPENQNLVTTLQKAWRQLRRYGGAPELVLAVTDFLDTHEKGVRAKGNSNHHDCANKSREETK